MKVLDVKLVEISYSPIEYGCNNGKYPLYEIITDEVTLTTLSCRCGKGCSNTSCLPNEGMEFINKEDLYDYMNGHNYIELID